MYRILPSLLIIALTLLASCKKEEDDPTPTPIPQPVACGIAGARLQAGFLGEAFCPGVSLFADNAAGVITINGVSLSGSTLTLELDSLAPGNYAITQDANHILFTTITGAFESSNTAPASLTIVSHDLAANRIQGSFTGPLMDPLTGATPTVSGSFDMTYLE